MTTAENSKQLIVEAFPASKPPRRTEITDMGREREMVDDEVREFIDAFVGKRWTELNDDIVRENSLNIALLSEKAFKYYLPAFLLTSLNQRSLSGSNALPFTLSNLCPFDSEGESNDRSLSRFKLFNKAQKRAIRSFLEFVVMDKSIIYRTEEAQSALDGFWRK